jgi:hypothetical protein
MSKVYEVWGYNEWDESYPIGIFSTPEKAALVGLHSPYTYPQVSEVVIDYGDYREEMWYRFVFHTCKNKYIPTLYDEEFDLEADQDTNYEEVSVEIMMDEFYGWAMEKITVHVKAKSWVGAKKSCEEIKRLIKAGTYYKSVTYSIL